MKRSSAKKLAKANPGGRIEALEAENQSLRDALFAILRSLGRVRVTKDQVAELAPGDGMSVRDLGDAWLFEFAPNTMVVPQGVTNGRANGTQPTG